MSKFVRKAKWIVEYEYYHKFVFKNDPSRGFYFPCDQEGKLLPMPELAKNNYEDCIKGDNDTIYLGIERRENRYKQPAVIKCHCGREVELHRFTNTCQCGADYNMDGSLLAHRSQWGEETGESWWECY